MWHGGGLVKDATHYVYMFAQAKPITMANTPVGGSLKTTQRSKIELPVYEVCTYISITMQVQNVTLSIQMLLVWADENTHLPFSMIHHWFNHTGDDGRLIAVIR